MGQTNGAHCPGMNRDHLGLCFLGNFNEDRLEGPQAETFRDVVGILGIQIPPTITRITLHREVRNTDCPGKNIERETLRKILEG